MKAIDCILEVSSLLNMDSVKSYVLDYKAKVLNNLTPSAPDSAVANKISQIITCINMAIERISSEYLPLKMSESLVSDSTGKILYSSASKRVFEIIKVEDANLNYRVIPYFGVDYIVLPKPNTSYIVYFRYIPDFIDSISGEFEISPFVTTRLLSYAVVSDILLVKNSFDEAREWNDRFLQGIKMIQKMGRSRLFKVNSL